MENGPLEDAFPIEHADSPGSYVSSPEGNILVIWVFPKIGIPQNGWFMMENPIKMDDLGVPLSLETLIYCTPCELLAVLPWCRFSGQHHRPADSLRHGLGKLLAFGHLHQVCCAFWRGNQTENVVVTCMFVVFFL